MYDMYMMCIYIYMIYNTHTYICFEEKRGVFSMTTQVHIT
jgi:hypothetical protein